MEDIWKKTGRAIEEENVPKAMTLIEKGKKLTKNRLKALRIADNEGWDTALAYLSDDLASCSEEEKRMKKARRVVHTNRVRSGFVVLFTKTVEKQGQKSAIIRQKDCAIITIGEQNPIVQSRLISAGVRTRRTVGAAVDKDICRNSAHTMLNGREGRKVLQYVDTVID